MSDPEFSKEERILRAVKRALTDVAKDTYTRPGYRHPLSDDTIEGIRQCLALISARESELAAESGRPMDMRPRFADKPHRQVVVPLEIKDCKKREDDSD
jgi:hypothetical protein